MKPPPARIDGALVLEWAWSDVPFGEVRFTDGTLAAVIHGLSLCRYGNDSNIYRFSCKSAWETAQDFDHDSVEEAKRDLPDQYRNVPAIWHKC